jgi:hypothetical protein
MSLTYQERTNPYGPLLPDGTRDEGADFNDSSDFAGSSLLTRQTGPRLPSIDVSIAPAICG